MEKIINSPFLPQNMVNNVLVGAAAETYINELFNLGLNPILINSENALKLPLCGHIDMLVNHYGNNIFYIDKSQEKVLNELSKLDIEVIVINDSIQDKYPYDVKLNCVRMSNNLICNKKTVSKNILEKAEFDGLNIIDVKQGYTKCSILLVDTDAVITDDETIYNALKNNLFDVLLVEKGSIALPGYNYGFVGGCGGLISKKEMVFFGDIKKHNFYNDIKAFLSNYKIDIISLSNKNLLDVGSIIPLTECEDNL